LFIYRNVVTEMSRDRNGPDRNGSDRNGSDRKVLFRVTSQLL